MSVELMVVSAAVVLAGAVAAVLAVRHRRRDSAQSAVRRDLSALETLVELLAQDARRGSDSVADWDRLARHGARARADLDALAPRVGPRDRLRYETLSRQLDHLRQHLDAHRGLVDDVRIVERIRTLILEAERVSAGDRSARLDAVRDEIRAALPRAREGDTRRLLERGLAEVETVRARWSGQLARDDREMEATHALHQRSGSMLDAMQGGAAPAAPAAPAAVPAAADDRVHVTVTGPVAVAPGSSFVLDVWAHLDHQRADVVQRAREAAGGQPSFARTKGPLRLARGTALTVAVTVDRLEVPDPEDTILWDGEVAGASFVVRVPDGSVAGACAGTAALFVNGLRAGSVHFVIRVGGAAGATEALPSTTRWIRSAFASYATEDRDDVLGVILGLEKGNPGLQVFFAEKELRAGDRWQARLWQEIEARDVFYLFWSEAAARSPWVEREWRCAYERRGIEFIDPVPLVSPELVRPPPELGDELHFNHWVTAYRRRLSVAGPDR